MSDTYGTLKCRISTLATRPHCKSFEPLNETLTILILRSELDYNPKHLRRLFQSTGRDTDLTTSIRYGTK